MNTVEECRHFKIVRFRRNPNTDEVKRRTIKKGLTQSEAMAHCQRDDTHGKNWFDGWTD
jgi:hypothetical protein